MNSLENNKQTKCRNIRDLHSPERGLGHRIPQSPWWVLVSNQCTLSLLLTAIWWYYWTWFSELGERAHTPAELSLASEAVAQVPRWQLQMLSDFWPCTPVFQGARCLASYGRELIAPPPSRCSLSPRNHTSFQSVKLKGSYHSLSPQIGFPQIEPPAQLLKMGYNNILKGSVLVSLGCHNKTP